MWSLGILLLELCTGDTIFPTDDAKFFMAVQAFDEPFPEWMLENAVVIGQGTEHDKLAYFRRKGEKQIEFQPFEISIELNSLLESLKRDKRSILGKRCDSEDCELLFQLILDCLRVDPMERISSLAALVHPLFDVNLTI
jgi:serine/threonine protein kinase